MSSVAERTPARAFQFQLLGRTIAKLVKVCTSDDEAAVQVALLLREKFPNSLPKP